MFEILGFGLFFSVMGIIIKIIKQGKCPTDTELRKTVLFRSNINDPAGERVIAHLGLCEKCRDRVAQLNK